MSIWYRTGTINLTNGSTALTGTGTAWVANVSPGMMVVYDRQIIGEVAAVVSNTSITLATAYAGSTISAGAYAIANLGAVRDGLIAAVNDALAAFQAEQDGPLSGRFGDGTLAEPGLAFLADLNTGFRRPDADQIGMVTGGVQRALLSSAALDLSVPITGSAVQSSPTDATAGRVLLNLAHGLGAAIPTAVTNLNDAMLNGWCSYASTATNKPFAQGGTVFVMSVNGARTMQMAFEHDTGRMAVRHISDSAPSSGSWTAWRRIDGAETITNANGTVERFANGFQICRHQINLGSIVASGAGTLASPYESASGDWTFPAAFSAAPRYGMQSATLGAASAQRSFIATPFAVTATGMTGIKATATTSIANARNAVVDLVAFGPWA